MKDRKAIRVVVFPGGFNLPLWAAIDQGFYDLQGIEIDLHYTASSVDQLSGLASGQWDLGLTGFDNIVAYQEGQGAVELEIEPDLFAFMGGDSGFLHLVVQPGIRAYDDLRGKVLSVDALSTGFAFVLRKMLALNGIREDQVSFDKAGGVLQRFEAMRAGRHAGTLMLTPFELMGKRVGLRILQSASEVLPHYQGICGAARRAWAQENRSVLTAFVRGYMDGLEWLFEPDNKQAACQILANKVAALSGGLDIEAYDLFTGSAYGFDPRASLDLRGIEAVLALRSEYGVPRRALTNPKKYFDLQYYDAALKPNGRAAARP